jgi:DNA-binding beta-propeller fold protein YncE
VAASQDAPLSGAARAAVAERKPLRIIADPNFSFAGVAVDPVRNEVVLADENVSALVVYDRLTNTPPTAERSQPKRVIGGDHTFVEFANSVYIDPENGDIYGVNNDTMNWLPVFSRDAQGDVPPTRALQTPHTTFAIAVDEAARELFLTIQDDHAVVVFDKYAKDANPNQASRAPSAGMPPPSPLRILQGGRTELGDPHGIAIDPKRGEMFVANWGLSNDRPPLAEGGGGGSVNRKDFPVGRRRAFRGSGIIQPPSITVYPKNARGDSAPLRVIRGARSQMNWPTALAVHPDRGELFVANDTGDSVLVFRTDASGDAAPIRVLKGPQSLIKNPTGVAVDLKNNELWVANFGNHSATVFPIDATGDPVPLRVIRSAPVATPSPMLSNGHTVVFDSKREEILVAS